MNSRLIIPGSFSCLNMGFNFYGKGSSSVSHRRAMLESPFRYLRQFWGLRRLISLMRSCVSMASSWMTWLPMMSTCLWDLNWLFDPLECLLIFGPSKPISTPPPNLASIPFLGGEASMNSSSTKKRPWKTGKTSGFSWIATWLALAIPRWPSPDDRW